MSLVSHLITAITMKTNLLLRHWSLKMKRESRKFIINHKRTVVMPTGEEKKTWFLKHFLINLLPVIEEFLLICQELEPYIHLIYNRCSTLILMGRILNPNALDSWEGFLLLPMNCASDYRLSDKHIAIGDSARKTLNRFKTAVHSATVLCIHFVLLLISCTFVIPLSCWQYDTVRSP